MDFIPYNKQQVEIFLDKKAKEEAKAAKKKWLFLINYFFQKHIFLLYYLIHSHGVLGFWGDMRLFSLKVGFSTTSI
jgi:hypothetical protein